jgi:hypothetical protein
MTKTFYELLEVSSDAPPETIEAAFQTLTKEYAAKADAGTEDAENWLKFLRAAYEALSNPQRRAKYDERLSRESKAVSTVTNAASDSLTRVASTGAAIATLVVPWSLEHLLVYCCQIAVTTRWWMYPVLFLVAFGLLWEFLANRALNKATNSRPITQRQ